MKKVCILILGVGILFVLNYSKSKDVVESSKSNILKNSNTISMMIETDNDGIYEVSKESSWPTNGYIFNGKLSKCENGGNLTWDSVNNKVIFDGDASDKCYVYFNKIPKLASYIKSLYKGQGINNLYLHDSTLENGAGDNSYRYAGSSNATNNFVCFGYNSTDGTCPTDNLYRIIGVFDNKVKLIKYDYANSNLLGTDGDYYNDTYSKNEYSTYKGELITINRYYWNNSDTSFSTYEWNKSRLNTINLNNNFINNIGSSWSSKIATSSWQIGGNDADKIIYVPVSTAYQNELVNPFKDSKFQSKIGLMYVSDYGYAAAPSAWTTQLSNILANGDDYGIASIINVNWMYMGLKEWTISHVTTGTNRIFNIDNDGSLGHNYVNNNDSVVRPVFFLEADVAYVSGTGTKANPIIITS